MGEVDFGKASESKGYKYIYTKALGAVKCQELAQTSSPRPQRSPLQPSQRTLGQVSEVRKLKQSSSPDRSFSLQGSLEANFIKDQVAGPTQYK